jgi:hypothetical protein
MATFGGIGLAFAAMAVVTLVSGQAGAGAVPEQHHASASPAPHILEFARDLHGERMVLPDGPSPVPMTDDLDGCDHDYGTAAQCVPYSFPPGTTNACTWLAEHGFGPIAVKGRDRHNLDTDHDGIACNAGDDGVK